MVVISTIVFLTIIITAVIVTIFPTYKPGTSIASDAKSNNYWDQGLSDVGGLPPVFAPHISVTNSSIIDQVNTFNDPNYAYSKYLKEYLDFRISSFWQNHNWLLQVLLCTSIKCSYC
nr:hypothetical protein [Mycoplasmopsis bovis]